MPKVVNEFVFCDELHEFHKLTYQAGLLYKVVRRRRKDYIAMNTPPNPSQEGKSFTLAA
jgi:hypothetical protein